MPTRDIALRFRYATAVRNAVILFLLKRPGCQTTKRPVTTIDNFIVEDLATDIIQLFAHNHKEAAKYLLLLPDFIDPSNLSSSIYDIIVETAFAELLKLPRSRERPVYYMTLIADLCRSAPAKIPSALGRAIRAVFAMMDGVECSLDVDCIRRFGEWFAHHLSNFGFNWKWAEW
jgi:nuclear cap-binding protein subunit 1